MRRSSRTSVRNSRFNSEEYDLGLSNHFGDAESPNSKRRRIIMTNSARHSLYRESQSPHSTQHRQNQDTLAHSLRRENEDADITQRRQNQDTLP